MVTRYRGLRYSTRRMLSLHVTRFRQGAFWSHVAGSLREPPLKLSRRVNLVSVTLVRSHPYSTGCDEMQCVTRLCTGVKRRTGPSPVTTSAALSASAADRAVELRARNGQMQEERLGGGDRSRTGDGGFADLCLTTWLRRPGTGPLNDERQTTEHIASASASPREGGLERVKGLEPSTFCMASRRSSQLSYTRSKRG